MRRAAIKAVVHPAAVLACVLVAAIATNVLAEEAIPTAAGAPGDGAPPVPRADPESGPLRLSDRIDEGPDMLRPVGPCGGPARKEDGKPDRTPHGEVWAGVGTGGYREIGGAVCTPLGDAAALSVAVDAGHMDGWRHRR